MAVEEPTHIAFNHARACSAGPYFHIIREARWVQGFDFCSAFDGSDPQGAKGELRALHRSIVANSAFSGVKGLIPARGTKAMEGDLQEQHTSVVTTYCRTSREMKDQVQGYANTTEFSSEATSAWWCECIWP